MGGTLPGGAPGLFTNAGRLAPAGTPLAGSSQYLASGYHYVSLSLLSPQLNYPWHFPAAYLTGPPFTLPLGTDVSITTLNWRALPLPANRFDGTIYTAAANRLGINREFYSSGAILFDHLPDVI